MTNYEHSFFVQDDWKLTDRITVNLGLRYDIFVPDTETENRLVNFDPQGMRLVYAGEDGTDRRVNKQIDWGNLAPRLGVAWDVTGNAKNVVRAGYGRSFFPVPLLGRQPARPAGALHDLAELQRGDEPPRVHPRPGAAALESLPADRAGQADDDGGAQRGQPARVGAFVLERDPEHADLAGELRAPDHEHPDGRGRLRGQQGPEPDLVLQHQRGPARPRLECLAPAHPAALERGHIIQCDTHEQLDLQQPAGEAREALLHGLQFLASYTFGKSLDYAGSAASGGGAVGGPQSVTLFDESRGPSGFDVKHRLVLSWVWALPFGEGHSHRERRHLKPILGNWQFSGIVTLSTGRPFTVFLNTGVNNGAPSWPNRIGDGKLDDPRPTCGSTSPTSRRLRPTPTATRAAASSTRRAPRPWTCRSRASSRSRGRFRLQFRADAFNLFNTPQFGFPNANIGTPERRAHHLDDRRQPLDAVRAEAGLVSAPEGARVRAGPEGSAVRRIPRDGLGSLGRPSSVRPRPFRVPPSGRRCVRIPAMAWEREIEVCRTVARGG